MVIAKRRRECARPIEAACSLVAGGVGMRFGNRVRDWKCAALIEAAFSLVAGGVGMRFGNRVRDWKCAALTESVGRDHPCGWVDFDHRACGSRIGQI